jgi:energy-converting hydrogenase A subunit M
MDPIFVPLLTEAIKFAGSILSDLITKPKSQNNAESVKEVTNNQYNITQNNVTLINDHILDKNYLQDVIGRTSQHLANLIQATTQDILQEIRKQHIQLAVQEVQARVNVLTQLLNLQNLDPNIVMQVVTSSLNPLQVSIEIARLRLMDHGEKEAWRLCYLTGTSALLAGYAFINQDMPFLKEEVRASMKEVQIMMLDEIGRHTFSQGNSFPWDQVPFLLSLDGIDELLRLYSVTIRASNQGAINVLGSSYSLADPGSEGYTGARSYSPAYSPYSCPTCGYTIPALTVFCANCGTRIG